MNTAGYDILETGWYMPEVLAPTQKTGPDPVPAMSFEEAVRDAQKGERATLQEMRDADANPELAARLDADAEALAKAAMITWDTPLT